MKNSRTEKLRAVPWFLGQSDHVMQNCSVRIGLGSFILRKNIPGVVRKDRGGMHRGGVGEVHRVGEVWPGAAPPI